MNEKRKTVECTVIKPNITGWSPMSWQVTVAICRDGTYVMMMCDVRCDQCRFVLPEWMVDRKFQCPRAQRAI